MLLDTEMIMYDNCIKSGEVRLGQIAEALGQSTNAFLDCNRPDADLEDTRELLRIWEVMEHTVDRRKLLAFARALVARK